MCTRDHVITASVSICAINADVAMSIMTAPYTVSVLVDGSCLCLAA